MKCPTCGKPAERKDNPSRPFCSERCKMVDLGRWVNEEYCVPGKTIPSESTTDSYRAPRDPAEIIES